MTEGTGHFLPLRPRLWRSPSSCELPGSGRAQKQSPKGNRGRRQQGPQRRRPRPGRPRGTPAEPPALPRERPRRRWVVVSPERPCRRWEDLGERCCEWQVPGMGRVSRRGRPRGGSRSGRGAARGAGGAHPGIRNSLRSRSRPGTGQRAAREPPGRRPFLGPHEPLSPAARAHVAGPCAVSGHGRTRRLRLAQPRPRLEGRAGGRAGEDGARSGESARGVRGEEAPGQVPRVPPPVRAQGWRRRSGFRTARPALPRRPDSGWWLGGWGGGAGTPRAPPFMGGVAAFWRAVGRLSQFKWTLVCAEPTLNRVSLQNTSQRETFQSQVVTQIGFAGERGLSQASVEPGEGSPARGWSPPCQGQGLAG